MRRPSLAVVLLGVLPVVVVVGALAFRAWSPAPRLEDGGRRKMTRAEFDRYARALIADVASHPDDDDRRERLVASCLATGQDELALQHIARLQERAAARDDDDAETRLGLLAAHTALAAGMPLEAETILTDLIDGTRGKKIPPGREEAFEQLAMIVATHRGEARNAEKVFDRMTDAYPRSPRAWANLGSARLGNGRLAEAEGAFAKAAELDPNDTQVALLGVELALARGDFDAADRLLDGSLAEVPVTETILLSRMRTATAKSGLARGIEVLRDGLSAMPDSRALSLALIDALADSGQMEELREFLSGLEAPFDAESAVARYGVARLAMLERRWLVANQLWLSLEQDTALAPAWASRLTVFRATCEEALGRPDRAAALRLEGAGSAAETTTLADVMAYEREGRHAEALALFRQIFAGLPVDARPSALVKLLRLELAVQAARPASARTWSEIDGWLAELAGLPSVDQDELRSLRVDVLIAKGHADVALREIESSLAKRPDDAGAVVLAARLLSGSGRRAEALERVVAAPAGTRDDPRVIAMEVSLAATLPGDEAQRALEAVESRVDALPTETSAMAAGCLFAAMISRGDDAGATRIGARLLAIDPDDLAVRQALLESATEREDVEGARRQAEAIAARVGRESAQGRVALALAEMTALRARLAGDPDAPRPDALPSAERRRIDAIVADLEEVARENPQWPAVHRALATAEDLAGDPDAMIGRLRVAAGLEREPVARRRLVLALVRLGRVAEAVPEVAALEGLGGRAIERIRAEMTTAWEDVDSGLAIGRAITPPECRDVAQLDWWAGLLARSGRDAEAEEVCRRSIDVDPGRADPWITLLAVQSGRRRFGDAEATRLAALAGLRGAEARRFEEAEAIATGRVREFVARLRSQLESTPGDLAGAARLADFLLRHGYRLDAERELLRVVGLEAARGTPTRGWARRRLAELWGADPSETGWKRATDILAAGADVDEAPSFEDLALAARLTLRRADAASWRRGAGMMSQVARHHRLTVADRVLSATVTARLGERQRADARRQLTAIVEAEQASLDVLMALAESCLDDRLADEAEAWLRRIRAIAPRTPETLRAEARLALLREDRAAAATFVDRLIEVGSEGDGASGPARRLAAAATAEELGFPAAADGVYTASAERWPEAALAWARVLGARHRIDEATTVAEGLVGKVAAPALLATLVDVLSHTRDDALAARIEALAERVRAGSDGASEADLLGAVIAMLAGRTAEARGAIAELLDSGRLAGKAKCGAEANLAYLLAAPDTADEAERLVGRAIDQVGPQADLLDTRAVIRHAQGRMELALEDIDDALLEPTAVRHLHRATIVGARGDLEAARESLSRAREMGLDEGRLLPDDEARLRRLEATLAADGA